jgi:hypothetical protein
MTTADYVAIAVSPALIMALVGSLVFFLIAVMYTGDYAGRLNYAFALFVFAAVLVTRIAIEMGGERAALFALPLGVAMFLALVRFVEHPSPFSHLINLGLMFIVWWCAHKLTWDCTLIDDDQDSSGEGLMQRIGVDGLADAAEAATKSGNKSNELFEIERGLAHLAESSEQNVPVPVAANWWRRFVAQKNQPHTPGLWVLYFSLAALPLYGIGQTWIPAADTGRRHYAFMLLLVYVAAGLALLVTTSFLGLRRYLRQRRIEMPAPIAATWVGTGAALIVVVMFLAMLLPRPAAEVALSRVPWQAGSPGGHSTSRYAIGNDGKQREDYGPTSNELPPDGTGAPQQAGNNGKSEQNANASGENSQQSNAAAANGNSKKSGGESGEKAASANTQTSKGQQHGKSSTASNQERGRSDKSGQAQPGQEATAAENNQSKGAEQSANNQQNSQADEKQPASASAESRMPQHPQQPSRPQLPQIISSAVGGLSGLLKLVLYLAIALVVGYLVWKHRHELARAIADLVRDIRALLARLFGGRAHAEVTAADEAQLAPARRLSFADFRDPFATGDSRRISPEELVRYTFSAFEAWAGDHGCPRTPDITPHELVRTAVSTDSPMYQPARRMAQLYSELAYAARKVPREAADELHDLWNMMRAAA